MRLRQLQVIHRHGDRTPLINIFRGSTDARDEEAEVELWGRKLPLPPQVTQLRSKYEVHTNSEAQTSFQQRPFGYLTTRGIEQMTNRGNWLQGFIAKEEVGLNNVTSEQMQIFSNAYTRTQLSVQALLGGMLTDHPQVIPQISVLPPDRDIINTYQIYPEIMRIKSDLVNDNEEFAAREHEMTLVKQELSRLLPAVDSGQIPFSWLQAADYFICRRAHHVPFISGTEVHGKATERHLKYRFHQFYSHRTILKLVAGRLMHNVLHEMQKLRWDHLQSKKITIYSGHDVSLLSILRAMDAGIAKEISYWPEYSSALALELLEDEKGIFYVRAQLNGEPLAMVDAPDGLISADYFCDLVTDRIGTHSK
ncbi:histidine acid [Plasmopara halstedii]|uniref:Histidine acid n=1 Tax=Plasmopara halstedii TaxID=4781 RepID=A0A0P1AR55_PLAHL|nr:histidine acid [Plasmopara halstedii]CEG43999.1 histidine acid [Plasmopara halstedii]|eukprot:XP_024580368.1 histidine acid [Plasmopara halstedii]